MSDLHRKQKLIGLLRKIASPPKNATAALYACKMIAQLEGWLPITDAARRTPEVPDLNDEAVTNMLANIGKDE